MPQLSPAAGAILATLAEHPNSTVAELARLAGIHHATPYGILPGLERRGLVVRHRAPGPCRHA